MEQTKYDILISCKSEDYTNVEPVYHWLNTMGHRPFFAPISLKISTIQGEPIVFGDEIDDNMIVFASKAEYLKTGYVKDEWRTFVEEQRAGCKSVYFDGVNIAELPLRLRFVQSLTPSNYKEGILRFLGNPSRQFEPHLFDNSNLKDKESFVKDCVKNMVLSEAFTNLQKLIPISFKTKPNHET